MKSRADNKKYYSIRLQIVMYCFVSVALAAVTMLVLSMAFYGVYILVQGDGNADRAGSTAGNYKPVPTWYPDSYYSGSIPQPEGASGGTENSGRAELPAADRGDESGAGLLPFRLGERAGMKRSTAIVLTVLGMGGLLVFFLLYFLALTKKLSDYLGEIAGGIRCFSAGKFETRIALRQSNELTQIADSFNQMAEELEYTVQEERRAENEKSEIITSIAHDLRTPLTSVIGYLELVAERDLTAETRAHYISVAYRKAKRLQRLTDDLFSYIKYGSEQVPLELSRLDAAKLVEQMIEEFYPSIQENNLELTLEKKVGQAWVEADGMLLARAFANLLGNAIKYGRDGKLLQVLVEQEQDKVRIHIINYGEVIPNRDLANIFERFYRVDSSRTEEQGGTGLGLAIAKNIIELHRGSIGVKSDFGGTEFTVELPAAAS
ncbi:MAG: HAMP domain-containing histidine kinase [Lachnospiraceae bacterium]|nr:HAMP domain-containing histidine kinase [Lachnospiraceae bacterium]